MALSESFSSLWQLVIRRPLWLIFLCCSAHQAHKGTAPPPCWGPTLVLSLKCFSSVPNNCPDVGIGPLLRFLNPTRTGQVLLTLLFIPPISFILWSFVWFYILFSSGQVLLHALSWCYASTSVSEGIERCTPQPPTPLPSCFLSLNFSFCKNNKVTHVSYFCLFLYSPVMLEVFSNV